MLLRILFLLFILPGIISGMAACAQEKKEILKGQVVDEKERPLSFASIALLNADHKEVERLISDSMGRFSFEKPVTATILYISYTGYDQVQLAIGDPPRSDYGKIRLKAYSGTTDSIVVTAQQRLMEVDGGTISFNVSKSIDAQGATALDALKKAPGVFINADNSITLNGKSGVLILLDGKQTYLTGQELSDLLKSIPASGLKSIEIINSPTAKYDATGSAGIINIKTAKSGSKGFSGTATAGVSFGISPKQNGDFSFNYRTSRFNLYGGYNHFLGYYTYVYGSDRVQSGRMYKSYTDDLDKRQRIGTRVGFDYNLDKKNTIGILLNGNFVLGGGHTQTVTDIGDPAAMEYEERLSAENDYYFQRTERYNVNMNYRYEDARGRMLNLDADYGFFKKGNNNHQSNIYSDPAGFIVNQNRYHTINRININLKAFKVDHTTNLWKGILESGGKYSSVVSENNARFFHAKGGLDSLDNRRSNRFAFTEEIAAAYFNYKKTIRNWTLQGGLRIEHTRSHGRLQYKKGSEDSVQNTPRAYTNLFPSFSLSFKPAEHHSFSLAYSRRIDRPAYQDLNPFVYLLDELSFWQGNPFLQPQRTNRILLQYVYRSSFIAGLSWSSTDQYSARITDTVEAIKIAMIPRNLGIQKNISFFITQNLSLRKWWELSFNGTVYRLQNEVQFDKYRSLDLEQLAARASLQQRFKLPYAIAAELSFYINSKRLSGANEMLQGTSQLDLAFQKTLLKNKGVIRLGINDIYKGTGFNSTQSIDGLYMKSFGYYETRQIRLNFTYKFADNTVKAPRTRNSALESENGRIK